MTATFRSLRMAALMSTMAAALLAGAVSGCASPPPAPPLLDLAGAVAPPASAPQRRPANAAMAWRLAEPLGLPAALDREAVMVSPEPGRLQAWQGLRWSEPLRDTLPRLLADDLARARGAPVLRSRSAGAATLAPDAPVLHVELVRWEASMTEQAVRLQAHWWLEPASASTAASAPGAARSGAVDLVERWSPVTADGLVKAQRAALFQLADSLARDTVPR